MCWLYYADFGLKLKISLFKKKQHAHIHANSLKKIALPKLLSLPKKFKWPPPLPPAHTPMRIRSRIETSKALIFENKAHRCFQISSGPVVMKTWGIFSSLTKVMAVQWARCLLKLSIPCFALSGQWLKYAPYISRSVFPLLFDIY